jgi:hypothetical protein
MSGTLSFLLLIERDSGKKVTEKIEKRKSR